MGPHTKECPPDINNMQWSHLLFEKLRGVPSEVLVDAMVLILSMFENRGPKHVECLRQ